MLRDDYDSKDLKWRTFYMDRFCRPHRQLVENIYSTTSEQTAQRCVQYMELSRLSKEHTCCIEVPLDQYNEVVDLVEDEHAHLLCQGAFTYSQVRHIAEAGNIHHLQINDEGHIYFTDELISMSTAIAFAQSKWNGAERHEAIENSVYTGLTILGENFAQDVVSIQEPILDEVTRLQVKKLATTMKQKGRTIKKNCLYVNNRKTTGAYISEMLTGEKINCLVKEQLAPVRLFKTTAKMSTSVIGGLIGIILGASIGAFIPTVSTTVITIIGGMMGLIMGGYLATTLSRKILAFFVPTELLAMLKLFKKQLMISSEEFLLSRLELNQALHDFNTLYNLRALLVQMANSTNPEQLAKELIDNELTRLVRLRMYLHVPVNQEMYEMLGTVSVTKRKGAVA